VTEVAISSLVKRYGSSAAVDGISLEVRHGEFISLLGPSGCGKTTTLKCLAGFEDADSGRILFDGKDVSRLPPEKRDIGMVFQSYALFPHLTVARNLAFGLEMRRIDKAQIKTRVRSALDLVRLSGLEERYPVALSGGQQQRVALARALVIEPKILLLDEPLANLDAKLRDEMRGFIRDLQKRVGITTLYVTHDQAEAMTMSDRVVVMFAGKIAQADVPVAIYDRPANRAVADFVGEANMITGVVRRRDDGALVLATPSGAIAAPPSLQARPGERATLMARPEAIRLLPSGASETGLSGKIVDRYFHGPFIDYRVAVGQEIVTVHAGAPAIHGEGDPVVLAFDPARLWPIADACA
jgi:putative spermidine/putrescine transport system ATP-binding protein